MDVAYKIAKYISHCKENGELIRIPNYPSDTNKSGIYEDIRDIAKAVYPANKECKFEEVPISWDEILKRFS